MEKKAISQQQIIWMTVNTAKYFQEHLQFNVLHLVPSRGNTPPWELWCVSMIALGKKLLPNLNSGFPNNIGANWELS